MTLVSEPRKTGTTRQLIRHTQKHNYSIINKSLSPAAPTEREQATGYLGVIILRFTDAMLMTNYEVVNTIPLPLALHM